MSKAVLGMEGSGYNGRMLAILGPEWYLDHQGQPMQWK